MSYEWDNKKPTAQMLGRWQPFHEGHYTLFKEIVKKTGQVCIQIRDVQGVDDNPFDFETVKKNIFEALESFEYEFEIKAALNFDNRTITLNNYYEIELPLKVTRPSLLNQNGSNIARAIWPEENEINVFIEELLALKSERNRESLDISIPYSKISRNGKYVFRIVGRPSLSSVLNFMIGVKNPVSQDRSSKSACLWFNELRLTDFDKTKGWAANASLNMKLSDFGTISSSPRYTSVGFGSIQQRISERTREETMQYDASANLNLDKFLPSKSGVKLPLYISTSKTVVTPKYDPLDKDIPLNAAINSFDTRREREDYKKLTEERIESKSISLANVRKERVNSESRVDFWDIENFSTSFSYSERKSSNVTTQKGNTSTGILTNQGKTSWATQVGYTKPTYSVSALVNMKYNGWTDSYFMSTDGKARAGDGNSTNIGLRGWWRPSNSDTAMPSVSVGFDTSETDASTNSNTTAYFVGLNWTDVINPDDKIGLAFGQPQKAEGETIDPFLYEVYYKYSVNDSVTVTPTIFGGTSKNSSDVETDMTGYLCLLYTSPSPRDS